MKKHLLAQCRIFAWMTLLTGILYPLFITSIAQLTMKKKADGAFIFLNQKAVGAKLIGQKFESEHYFWSRPSSIDYNPLPSGGSNLGPISKDLKKTLEERKAKILKAHDTDESEIPSQLLFASGSGLDPHLSPEAVLFQAERIAKARNIEKEKIEALIHKLTISRDLRFLGEPKVNILELNLALDKIAPLSQK